MSTNTVLRNLQPDVEYKVTVVPVYADMEGKRQSENGKTSESMWFKEEVVFLICLNLLPAIRFSFGLLWSEP